MESIQRDELRTLLARYPALTRPCGELEALGNAGGYSGAQLWRYRSGQGWLVARAWPRDGPGRTALERMHGWLARAAGLGFIPVPLPALDGRTVQEQGGRLWEVSPWLDGASPAHPPLSSQLRAGFAALAAFHQTLGGELFPGPSPGIQARLHEVDDLLHAGFDVVQRGLDRAAADPCSAAARRWLALARVTAPRLVAPLQWAAGREVPLQPCLRDARAEHLLFSGDRLVGLIDFGAMDIETVAADLARLLGDWVGSDTRARALSLGAYTAVRPLEPLEITLIDVFEDASAVLGAGRWVRWYFLEGRTFLDRASVASGIERGLERLARRVAAWEGVGGGAG